jgi:hypothetical protein
MRESFAATPAARGSRESRRTPPKTLLAAHGRFECEVDGDVADHLAESEWERSRTK